MIATKFQRLHLGFRGQATRIDSSWWSTTRSTAVRKTIFLGSARCSFRQSNSWIQFVNGTRKSHLSRRECPTQWRLVSIFAYHGLRSPSRGRCDIRTAVALRLWWESIFVCSMYAPVAPSLTLSESTVWFVNMQQALQDTRPSMMSLLHL